MGCFVGTFSDKQGEKWAISAHGHEDLPPDLHGSIEPNSREIQRNHQETLFIYRRNSDRRKREEQQAETRGATGLTRSIALCLKNGFYR